MKQRIYFANDEQIAISKNEIHIWNFDLNKYLDHINKFKEILSGDELIRAGKFHFQRDKNWFIIGRGLLKLFLKIYSSIPASEINFSFNKFGKPSLSPAHNKQQLHFNLSHTKNFLSIGFASDFPVGIDIEQMKPLKNHLEIAKRFFSKSEVEQLLSFPADKILDGFYSCWTAKEAVIKLSGEGLSFPLKEFDVELKDLKVGESYKYKIKKSKRLENLAVEVCKLYETLYGACAVNNNHSEIIYCGFDDANAIHSLLS
jgi:4'-phosphopantetheinyl transferase